LLKKGSSPWYKERKQVAEKVWCLARPARVLQTDGQTNRQTEISQQIADVKATEIYWLT